MGRRTQSKRKPEADEGNVAPTDSASGTVDVVLSRVQLRPAADTMLTFASASSPNLDAFFEIIVDLLLDRLEQLSNDRKEL
jgi:hypothetical protein